MKNLIAEATRAMNMSLIDMPKTEKSRLVREMLIRISSDLDLNACACARAENAVYLHEFIGCIEGMYVAAERMLEAANMRDEYKAWCDAATVLWKAAKAVRDERLAYLARVCA